MRDINALAEQMGAGDGDEPYIRAHHTCQQGGLCAPCQEHEDRLLDIEARERAKERAR